MNESFRDVFYFTFINSIEKGWQLLLLCDCDNTLVFEMVVSDIFLVILFFGCERVTVFFGVHAFREQRKCEYAKYI